MRQSSLDRLSQLRPNTNLDRILGFDIEKYEVPAILREPDVLPRNQHTIRCLFRVRTVIQEPQPFIVEREIEAGKLSHVICEEPRSTEQAANHYALPGKRYGTRSPIGCVTIGEAFVVAEEADGNIDQGRCCNGCQNEKNDDCWVNDVCSYWIPRAPFEAQYQPLSLAPGEERLAGYD